MKKFFAKRTDWPRQANSLASAYEQLRSEGVSVIDLTASNPTDCSINYPEGFLDVLSQANNCYYAPDPIGMGGARDAISAYYKKRGFAVHKDQIVLTSSTSEAYDNLFRLLANYGDHVLFPQPSYPLFSFLGDLNDIILDRYQLDIDKSWALDLDNLKDQINEYTKALVCVNPNNPTGSYISQDEVSTLNQLCLHNEIPIICDEVFWDFRINNDDHYISLIENKEVLTFTLGGLSKLLALPQMKLSWVVISGPDKLQEEARSRLEIIADTYLSVNTPVQNALPEWIAQVDTFQKPVLARIRDNYVTLSDKLKHCRSCSFLGAQGGWYAVLKIKGSRSEEEWALKLLNKYHVFVYPGYFFDFKEEKFLVMSLLVEPKNFEEGVSRLLSRMEQEVS